jgi:archaeosine-15-forming tRNA-guanine transglycosylase
VVRYIQFYLDIVKAIAIHHIQIKFRNRENVKSQFLHLSQIMRSHASDRYFSLSRNTQSTDEVAKNHEPNRRVLIITHWIQLGEMLLLCFI